jgi:3D (Asp-Asp-Asp) domain-containing protein
MAPDRLAKTVATLVDPIPAKHVTFVRNGTPQTLETHAATAGEFLAENGVSLAPDDVLDVPAASQVTDGETIVYRAALPVSLTVDGRTHFLRSPATTVGALLSHSRVAWDRHDDVSPPAETPLANDLTIVVRHVGHWTEIVRRPVAPTVVKRWALTLPTGQTQVLDAGQSGMAEVTYRVERTPGRRGVHRTELANRILRPAHDRVVVEGVAEYTALSELARREMAGTLKLATSALQMVATAYTAHCGGCSGTTAMGQAAGHGIVAVDPAVIPLGTKMFIPGYGKAIAGDTGGAIRGRRIDLGFNSRAQANQFGRRPVVVYLYR